MLIKHNFFSKNFKKYKKKKALIIEEDKFITYEELIKISGKIYKKIDTKKKLIFLIGQNNIESIVGYISFINKGHTVVFLDSRLNIFFFKKLLNLYKPYYVYCEKNFSKKIKFYKKEFIFQNYVLFKSEQRNEIVINDNLMLLMPTSGSTGSPKFVRLSYDNVISNTKNIIKYLNIKSKDITITSLPMTYVYGLSVINTHLIKGATIVLTNKSMIEKNFWSLVENFKVTNFSGVPYNYIMLEKYLSKNIPKSIKYATQAGGKMNAVLLNKIIKIFKGKKIKFIQMYGAAEATARMSYLNWSYAEKKIGSIGKPIPGGRFYLVKKNGQRIKGSHIEGELIYKGKNVFMGYAEKPDDLELPDLQKNILNTGDIAYRDEGGFYYVVGRKDRYVKIFGLRINLSELEYLLSKKGLDVIMRKGKENKINVYTYNFININENIDYLTELTSINKNVFEIKKISKKNLTTNLKFKL